MLPLGLPLAALTLWGIATSRHFSPLTRTNFCHVCVHTMKSAIMYPYTRILGQKLVRACIVSVALSLGLASAHA